MSKLPGHCQVLIAGAGPSGLMMAAQLLRFGIQPVIVDSKTELTMQSRAIAVQARSLEIFRQLGIVQEVINEGNKIEGLTIHEDTEAVAHFDLAGSGKGNTAFPFVLSLEQSKTERLLLDFLTSRACPVHWNSEVTEINQTGTNVEVRVRTYDGREETIVCNWLIGADGASGIVRKRLGIAFTGGTYLNRFYLADLSMKHGPASEDIRIFIKDEGFTGIFPMKDGNYRFIGVLPKTLRGRENISFNDVKPYITYTLGIPIDEDRESCYWFSVYQIHHRMAERFRSRRCFLIGDAAHIHSPVGGQGMNTGLQDAYNLAWKLAGVIRNNYSEQILDSYASERMPVAEKLLKTTDRLFSLVVSQNWVVKKIRNGILPIALKWLWRKKGMPHNIFALVSQTGVHYRQSSLSVHHGKTGKIRAGDRLPFLTLFDEKRHEQTDLHEWCSKPGFTLLVVGKLSQRDLHLLAKWIKSTYPFGLNFYYLPPSERNQHIFDCFEIKEDYKKALIVRPDLYIGYMNDIVDIELIGGYMKEVTGV